MPNRTPSTSAEIDRAILRLLSRDATLNLAILGEAVGLSAAAVHERVKKLKASGVIVGTVAVLNHDAIDRAFLAFIQLRVDAKNKHNQVEALTQIAEVEEIHSIAGQYSVMLKVRARDARSMEGVFQRIYAIDGVEDSQTIVVFSTYIDRPTRIGEDEG